MSDTILTLLSQRRLAESYAAGHWRDETIFSIAAAHAAAAPDRVALRDRRGPVTYSGLVSRAEELATALFSAGVRKSQRVAVWLPSRAETAVVLLACSLNGYACCPSLHRDHTSDQVAGLLRRMGAAAFIGETGYGADNGDGIFAKLGKIPTLKLSADLAENPLPAGPGDGPGNTDSHSGPNTDPNIVSYLAFTSGTTGKPKGVMHSDNTLLANARAMIEDWAFGRDSVIYSMSPLSHNLGLGALIMAIAAGGQVVLHDQPRGASTLDRLLEVDATFIVGVPTHAIDLIAELKSRDLPAPGRIKGFRISGASASPDVIADLLDAGIVPQSGYGMTEAGSHHYTRMDDPPERIAETSGRACASYEVTIWDLKDPDRQLGVGEEGEIGGRGAGLMLGYFEDPAANEAAFNAQGWFMTGDIGRLDDHSYLKITGRKKDLIVRGGHNIYPATIEAMAAQHPAVARAAAVPIADVRLGEKVCLAITCVNGQAVAPDELLAHLDQLGLSRYHMPEYVLAIDEMPLTASGKILKRSLVDQINAGELSPRPVRWQGAGPAAD